MLEPILLGGGKTIFPSDALGELPADVVNG